MASQILGTPLEPNRLLIVSSRIDSISPERSESHVDDNGLGCIRGLMFAMVFNGLLILTGVVGWKLLHHLLR
jgi:hypothetical protein